MGKPSRTGNIMLALRTMCNEADNDIRHNPPYSIDNASAHLKTVSESVTGDSHTISLLVNVLSLMVGGEDDRNFAAVTHEKVTTMINILESIEMTWLVSGKTKNA
jgi:hypothetical protein